MLKWLGPGTYCSGNSDNCTKKGRAAFRKRNTMCVKSIDGVKDLVPSDDLCEIPTNAAFF